MTDRIEKSIELNAPIERVWRAITDHAEFGQWFRVKLDGPFVAGETSTGRITYPGYEHLPWEAKIVAMESPNLFSYTWPNLAEAQQDSSRNPWTLVEFRLEAIAQRTRLTVVESGFDALSDGRREEVFRSNERGWAEQMTNIQAHVES